MTCPLAIARRSRQAEFTRTAPGGSIRGFGRGERVGTRWAAPLLSRHVGPRARFHQGGSRRCPGEAYRSALFQVGVDMLRQLEHRDRVPAVEDRLQLGVGADGPLVIGILKIVLADVIPD